MYVCVYSGEISEELTPMSAEIAIMYIILYFLFLLICSICDKHVGHMFRVDYYNIHRKYTHKHPSNSFKSLKH